MIPAHFGDSLTMSPPLSPLNHPEHALFSSLPATTRQHCLQSPPTPCSPFCPTPPLTPPAPENTATAAFWAADPTHVPELPSPGGHPCKPLGTLAEWLGWRYHQVPQRSGSRQLLTIGSYEARPQQTRSSATDHCSPNSRIRKWQTCLINDWGKHAD